MKKRFMALVLALVMCVGMAIAVPALAVNESRAKNDPVVSDDEAPMMLVTSSEEELRAMLPVNVLALGDEYVPDNPDAPMMIVSDEDGSIMPLDTGRLHIPSTDYTSNTEDYNASFTCKKTDGNRLNVWVRNNGTTSVYLNVTWSKFFGLVSEPYTAVEIPPYNAAHPGQNQQTLTFYYSDNAGIDGDWDINVTPLYGGPIDITVSARQYQVNP